MNDYSEEQRTQLTRDMLRDIIQKPEKHTERCAEYRKNSRSSICLCHAKERNVLRLEQIKRAEDNWGIKV